MIIHELKTLDVYFGALVKRDKTVEIRKDDRTPRFQVGDILALREVENSAVTCDGDVRMYTGLILYARVTHALWGNDGVPGVSDGYVALSLDILQSSRHEGHE